MAFRELKQSKMAADGIERFTRVNGVGSEGGGYGTGFGPAFKMRAGVHGADFRGAKLTGSM